MSQYLTHLQYIYIYINSLDVHVKLQDCNGCSEISESVVEFKLSKCET